MRKLEPSSGRRHVMQPRRHCGRAETSHSALNTALQSISMICTRWQPWQYEYKTKHLLPDTRAAQWAWFSVAIHHCWNNVLCSLPLEVQVVLEVNDEAQLKKLSEKLLASNIRHKLWMEQPENIPTSLALAPYRKTEVHQYVKRLKLCKSWGFSLSLLHSSSCPKWRPAGAASWSVLTAKILE